MINDIFVFDDIISKENQNILEDYVKNHPHGWTYGSNISYLKTGYEFGQYVLPPTYNFNSKILDIIHEIEKNVCDRLEKKFLKNYRFKINLLKVSENPIGKEIKKAIHIDRDNPHVSLVYYINNTDGNTSFYNFKGDNLKNLLKYVDNSQFNKFELLKEVSPKKGRVAVFDGMTPHHSNYPTKKDRYIVNMNIVIEEDKKTLL
jgi:hypothetical protein